MKRYLAVLLSVLFLITSAPLVSADIIYNDDELNWDEFSCPHNTMEEVGAVASTCVTRGHAAYTRCADCKALLRGSRDPLPLTEHTYDSANDSVCNVCGYVREVCPHAFDNACDPDCNEGCGYVREVGDHIYDNACDADCNECGAGRQVNRHSYKSVVTAMPTCGANGVMTYICAICGDTYTEVIPAIGKHTPVLVPGYAPTCTESGFTDGEMCSVCQTVLKDQQVIDAPGHTVEEVKGYAPTCETDGLTDGEMCSVCGEILVAQEIIPAIGHNYELTEDIVPTCTTAGQKVYTCANCGDSYEEVIDALGHTVETIKGYAPTCETDGLTDGEKCSVCGEVLVAQEIIPAIGHSYELTEDIAPTCTAAGKKVYTCANCGDSYEEIIGALGHSYDDDADAECNLCGHIREVLVMGDADGDGRVNNRDLGLLQKYVNEWKVTLDEVAADMDGNGKVNNRDLGLLQRLLNNQ